VSLIADRYGGLSPGHQRLADFILTRPHEAALMTLERLSEATGVSAATANRLATKLGLSGYPELKGLLRAELQEALRPVEALVESVGFNGLSRSAPWTQSMDDDVRRIRGIEAVGGDSAFTKASNLLAKARRIYLGGFGSSAFIAQYAGFYLSSIREGCEVLPDSSGMEGASRRLLGAGDGDVAILLGFARYSEQIVRLAEQFHKLNVPIICITDGRDSPLAPFAATSFLVERKAGFVLSGPGGGAIVVIEALVWTTALALGRDQIEERSARLTSLLGPAVLVPKTGEKALPLPGAP
jgi:DNA-binding MurR/RpiR family transcriptional regulator